MDPSTCDHGIARRACHTCYQRPQLQPSDTTSSKPSAETPPQRHHHPTTSYPTTSQPANPNLSSSPRPSNPTSNSHITTSAARPQHNTNSQPNKKAPQQTYQLAHFLSQAPDYKHLLITASDPSERGKKHRRGLKRKVRVWGVVAGG